MEDRDTTTHSHHIFTCRESFGTVGQQTTIVPVDFYLRHSYLRHVLTSRIDELHVLSVRCAVSQQQGRRTLNFGRITQLQGLERLVHDVASHITQSTCTIIPPSAPVPRMVDLVIRIQFSRTCEEIPVQCRRNLISLFRSVQTLRPDRTVGSAIYACYFTNLTIPDPFANEVCIGCRRTLVTHLCYYTC